MHFPSHCSLVQARKTLHAHRDTDKTTAEAGRCFHLKPAKLELISSSFYDVLDQVFADHFMKHDSLPETFLASKGDDFKAQTLSPCMPMNWLKRRRSTSAPMSHRLTRTQSWHDCIIIFFFITTSMPTFHSLLGLWQLQWINGLADVSVCHSAPAIKEEKVDRMRFTTSFTQATVLVLRSKCS